MDIRTRPIPMAQIPGGSRDPFGHPEGLRYLQRRPRSFVSLSDPKTPPPTGPLVRALEVRTAEE